MKKFSIRSTLAIFLSLVLIVNTSNFVIADDNATTSVNNTSVESSYDAVLLPDEPTITIQPLDMEVVSGSAILVSTDKSYDYGKPVYYFAPNTALTFKVNMDAASSYHMNVDYYIPDKELSELRVNVQVNGENQFDESNDIQLNAIWKDSVENYQVDSYGNQVIPQPERIYEWENTTLKSYVYNYKEPFVFNFQQGENTITFQNNAVGFYLGDISFTGDTPYQSFDEYMSSLDTIATTSPEAITIQGEQYTTKSNSYIRGEKSSDSNATPYSPKQMQISYLSGESASSPLNSVDYQFEVPEDGTYYITFKYKQDQKQGLPSADNIYIDGKVLFGEMLNYLFPYTGSNWSDETLNVSGTPIPFYLKKGTHTLTFETTADPYVDVYNSLLGIVNDLNSISLNILQVTGNSVDKNRDWNIQDYIPDILPRLQTCRDELVQDYNTLQTIAGGDSSASLINNLQVATDLLDKFINDLNFLVNHPEQLTGGANSVTEYISTVIDVLMESPLDIDEIYITSDTSTIPKPMHNFVTRSVDSAQRLYYSFVNQNDVAGTTKDDSLNIWTTSSGIYTDQLRYLVASEYKSDIPVNITSMPDPKTLVLAESSGEGPDAVIGVNPDIIYDFGLRGAATDLRQFDDFNSVMQTINPEFFVPMTIGDSCYGLPESINFTVLYYRKDILDDLGLSVPKTWDDVIEMIPTLEQYGMYFNTPLADVGSTKWLAYTYPYIYQCGGDLYSADGSQVDFNDPNTVEGFNLMVDLYTKYSIPNTIPNFYSSFRKGTTPIGMSDTNSFYKIKYAAPELAGEWDIAAPIGVEDPNTGTINNSYPSISTACMILSKSTHKQDAWNFLKWYMSTDTQTEYTTNMQLTYGPTANFNSANMEAFMQNTLFTDEQKRIIGDQLENTKEVPKNPAYQSVQVELSNAWTEAVFDGTAPRTALDEATIQANRDIETRLKEFGYMDGNGNLVKPYTLVTKDTIESWGD